jgi:transcription elongation factor S-II
MPKIVKESCKIGFELLQVRSRVFNLKDKKNRELRENVLCGVILPEKIATMTAEEMASDQVN